MYDKNKVFYEDAVDQVNWELAKLGNRSLVTAVAVLRNITYIFLFFDIFVICKRLLLLLSLALRYQVSLELMPICKPKLFIVEPSVNLTLFLWRPKGGSSLQNSKPTTEPMSGFLKPLIDTVSLTWLLV